jgi:hypothetical protein
MKIPLVSILFFTYSLSFSQSFFRVDSAGYFYCQDTVTLHLNNLNETFERLNYFLIQENGCVKKENESFLCTKNLYKSNFLRSLDGTLEYRITFEMQHSDLIYRVTDFTYTKLQRNRYGKYQKTNLVKKLSEPYPGNEENWKRYRLETSQYLQDFLKGLADYIK